MLADNNSEALTPPNLGSIMGDNTCHGGHYVFTLISSTSSRHSSPSSKGTFSEATVMVVGEREVVETLVAFSGW